MKRVFGDSIQHGEITVIPAARIGGGAGGGGGVAPSGKGSGEGSGIALNARPAGVYVLKDGAAIWRPAIDVNRIVLGLQIVLGIGLLILLRALRER